VFQRLPETGRLADALKELYKDGADVQTGLSASKSTLMKKTLNSYNRIVFATHGYYGNDIPNVLEPVLALSPPLESNPKFEEGFLRMTEVMGLRLNADLVALTACQTGLGRHLSGEGTMGMGRAFQYAGADSVLMSLWSVAESSSVKLTESLFRGMKEGKGKGEALTKAKEEIRNQGFDHPFYWAAFVLVGENN
ncbi:MAG: CHAT domain-containing protein, partial [Pseudomonadota bacterium]